MSEKRIPIPAKMVAATAKTSDSLVRKVRAGKRTKGKDAKRVLHADELLGERVNLLIEELKKVVNF